VATRVRPARRAAALPITQGKGTSSENVARGLRSDRAASPIDSRAAGNRTTVADRSVAPTASARTGVYASGDAHPPGDERLPRGADDEDAVDSDDATPASETPVSVVVRPRSIVSSVRAATDPKPEVGATDGSSLEPSRSPEPEQDAAVSKLPLKPSARELAQEAVEPRVLPIYSRSGHLIVPPPLRGSHEILVHQNEMADAAGLERIRNDRQLNHLRATHRLVNVSSSASLRVNPELPANRRCARPWTAHFAADIARAYYAQFSEPLELNSAVRTISYQLRLQRVNGNAASVRGETASPHLTGQAIDFGKRGMSVEEIAWMRTYLAPLMQAGAIDVEEEFQQACFHISVYRNYLTARRASSHHIDVAQEQVEPHAHARASISPIEEQVSPQDNGLSDR